MDPLTSTLFPASSSKPETGGQPPAARHDQAETPPERPAKPDAPATEQAGGSSRGSAGSQGASGKRQSPKARGSRGQGEKKGTGGGSGSGPLATCGASGPPRSVCSRSRRASRARGAGTPAASHAAGCAAKRPEFGTLARAVFTYCCGRRSGAAGAARATRIADGLPLEDTGGEGMT